MPVPAVFDNSSSAASAANVSSLTTPSWTIAGTNRYLYAGVCSGAGAPVDPTACKWGGSTGVNLTQNGTPVTIATNHRASIWELVAPAAANQTLYASWSGNQDETALGGCSYTGVNQITPSRTRTTNTGSGLTGPYTCTVTAANSANNDLVVDVVFGGDIASAFNPTLAVGAGQTSRVEIEGATLAFEAMGMSEEAATGANTVMSWTMSGPSSGGTFVSIALPLIPVDDSPPAMRGIRRFDIENEHAIGPYEMLDARGWF